MNRRPPIILGAGLSGCLAGIMNSDALILESKDEESMKKSPEHKAVLRFRTDKVSRVTGIPFRSVQVRKSVWSDGQEWRLPDIRLTNMYSKKVADGYYDRSIVNLETVTRYIAPEDFHLRLLNQLHNRIIYQSNVVEISNETIKTSSIGDISRQSAPVISTLPIPVMSRILKLDSPVGPSAARPVYVQRWRIKNCDLNVSMYYPDEKFLVYRASVLGDLLTIESVREPDDKMEARFNILEVQKSLGICDSDLTFIDDGKQIGKLNYNISEEARKNWILNLTINHGIYSLGRFAVWKAILQDDVCQDVESIRGWISAGTNYDLFKSMHNGVCNA